MRLYTLPDFLRNGGQLPPEASKFRAAAIHPSSEVDLVVVGGVMLGVGGIVPITGQTELRPVRCPHSLTNIPQGGPTPNRPCGETLVLQLYDACDELVPPGPRTSLLMRELFDHASLPDAASVPEIVMRVPMQGRSGMSLSFYRTDDSVDLEVFIVGLRLYPESAGQITQYTETWWAGEASAPVDAWGNLQARTVYFENEHFDVIVIACRGDAGSDLSEFIVEVSGEDSSQ